MVLLQVEMPVDLARVELKLRAVLRVRAILVQPLLVLRALAETVEVMAAVVAVVGLEVVVAEQHRVMRRALAAVPRTLQI
jgi:hypothetical protein